MLKKESPPSSSGQPRREVGIPTSLSKDKISASGEKIVIIDSHALIHRAYHALPLLTSPEGQPVQAVYGFASVLIKVLKELKPEYIVAAFDSAGPTFRHTDFEDYKAHRPATDDALINQFQPVKELTAAFGIPVLEKAGYEADDIIGTLVEQLKNKKSLQKIIVTGDLDCLQLIDDENVLVYTLKKGVSETAIYGEAEVKERFEGLGPNQMADYKGLKGDPSDNIPGVPGVGEKTAIALLKEYGGLEDLYKNLNKLKVKNPKLFEKLSANKEQAFLSKKLATINREAPIEFDIKEAVFDLTENEDIKKLFFRFGFRSLINRLDELKATPSETKSEANQGQLIGDIKSRGVKPCDGHAILHGDHVALRDELEDYFKKGIFSPKIYKLEKDLRPVLRRMEQCGVLLDVKLLKDLSQKFAAELTEIQKKITDFAGEEFNINSPKELGRIIFEKLSLGGPRLKKTKTGAYSTAFEELEKLKNTHPIFPLLLRWRELSKLKSTYVDALPKLVAADGRLHTTYKQLGAVTGRLASENPNLQNIPVRGEYGAEIRRAFVAPGGSVLLSVDYSQMELRLAAVMSGDKKMIGTFNKGEDIHSRTAAEVFDVPMEKVTKDMRREAKALNFGILYGMGPRAFAQSAGVSLSQAQEFIRKYESDFAGLAKFIREMKRNAYAQGFVETLWGRKRHLEGLSSGNPGLRAAAERMAVNMPIQGTSADIIKAAMVEIDKKFGGESGVKMLLQVHDQLVFEVKKNLIEKYAAEIKKIMEGVAKLAVPLAVDMEAGPSWGELKQI